MLGPTGSIVQVWLTEHLYVVERPGWRHVETSAEGMQGTRDSGEGSPVIVRADDQEIRPRHMRVHRAGALPRGCYPHQGDPVPGVRRSQCDVNGFTIVMPEVRDQICRLVYPVGERRSAQFRAGVLRSVVVSDQRLGAIFHDSASEGSGEHFLIVTPDAWGRPL